MWTPNEWTWNVSVKFALSLSALIGLISIAVIAIHSKTLHKNKITMCVYYLIICQLTWMTTF